MSSGLARRLDPYANGPIDSPSRWGARAQVKPELSASFPVDPSVNLGDYTSAGYYLSRRTTVADYAGIDLGRVSLASKQSERAFFPDYWTLSWGSKDLTERAARAAQFGFTADQLDSITQWADRSFGRTFGMWRAFFSLEDARSVGQSALGGASDIELWGVGLHRDLVHGYCLSAGISASHVRKTVVARKGLAEGGVVLGHDILLEELSSDFSSPDSRQLDEVAMFRKTGVAPNDDGLVDSYADARKCCRYLDELATSNRQNAKGWQPWLLVRYPLC